MISILSRTLTLNMAQKLLCLSFLQSILLCILFSLLPIFPSKLWKSIKKVILIVILDRAKNIFLSDLYFIYQVVFKYLYYLLLYGMLNLLYLTYFKSLSIDYSYANISNRIVPAVLRKYSILSGNYEVLTYFNFGILMTLGKILMFTYLPFGMAKFINNLLESLTIKNEKRENECLYNSIENAQLTRKIDICECLTIQIKNGLKIMFALLCFLTLITLVFTKIVIVWSKLSSNNICGVDCGLLSFRFDHNITFQNLLFYFQNYSHVHTFIFLSMMAFRIYSMIISVKTKGIALFLKNFYDLKAISKDPILTLLYISIFFILNIILFYDLTYVAPDYVRFFTLPKKCDFLQIDSPDCGITLYGLFYIRFSLNFIGFIYIDIFGSFVFIFSSTIWVFLLPIKNTFNILFNGKGTNYKENIQST